MLSRAPFPLKGRRTILLAEGNFSTFGAKTAVCYLRYRADDVVAVVDGSGSTKRVDEAIGFGGAIPVVRDIGETRHLRPEVAIVGTAPRGGQLDGELRAQVLECVQAGFDVVSGLHVFLGDDDVFVKTALSSGSRLWDVRKVEETTAVASGKGCVTGAKTVLVTGTDCNVGKMTATVEIFNEAVRCRKNVAWAATGQTGILLRERGICVDRVVADFIGGAAENLVNFEGRDKDLVIVEGQGSLIHPGYAGVTLGLMFGVLPDCLILAHECGRRVIRNYDLDIPPLTDLIRLHENAMSPIKDVPVVSVALNTAKLEPLEAKDAIAAVREKTGLPTGDPVRFGASEILDGVIEFLS